MLIKIPNEYGEISVSEAVIESIAGFVATHTYGVVGMASKSKAESLSGILSKEKLSKGIKVENKDGLVISLHIVVNYGMNIKALSDNLVDDVKYHVQDIAGVPVSKINVYVDDIKVDE